MRHCLALALLLAPPSAHAQDLSAWQPYIAQASARFAVPVRWIEQVIRAESGGHTHIGGRPIRSRKGAIGLMQLMPGTWADLRGQLGLTDDPDAPRANILAGTLYLRQLYDAFGYPGLFAAYHAGPGRYRRYLAGEVELPSETRIYLARLHAATSQPVLAMPGSAHRMPPSGTSLFAISPRP